MHVQRVSYQVKGFVRLNDYAIRYFRMVTEQAKKKLSVLLFWEKYGIEATKEAFKVSQRTLFNWKRQWKQGGFQMESLNERPKRPLNVRKRMWPQEIKNEIKKLRNEHPNLGKEKIHVLLKSFCEERRLDLPSESTIGNLIRDMGGLRIFPTKVRHNGTIVPRTRAKRARKPKQFKATYPGHCGSFDTVERIVHGSRKYVITFTDLYSRFSLAVGTTSHASLAAKEFFHLTAFLFPFPLKNILTDNGSEFQKHFDAEVKHLHKEHWHTYPKTPKMNAHAERFNRTLQEEYIDYHAGELLDTTKFNVGLFKHLLWHNTQRPHWGLKLKTPVQVIQEYAQECNMYLTNTRT